MTIYGFHMDGSECHSQHCALKHKAPGKLSTGKISEVEQEVIDRLRAVGHAIPIVPRPKDMPPIKFPPAPGTKEWWDALSPEERQRVQDGLAQSMARLSVTLPPIIHAFQELAANALPALNKALEPFAKAMQNWREDDEGSLQDGLTDTEREADKQARMSKTSPHIPDSLIAGRPRPVDEDLV